MDKPTDYKFIDTSSDDKQNYPFCRLLLVFKTFEHSTLLTNQSKFKNISKVA